MNKIVSFFLVFMCFSFAFGQDNGTLQIYNSGNFGIKIFNSTKQINSDTKDIYIQLGKYNYINSQNESGRYLKLNKNNLSWYIPYNGFINAAWGMYIYTGEYDCQPIPFFAVSPIDSNKIIKYVVTPAADCPDAKSFYTTNSGLSFNYAPFACGGVLFFPFGGDYNPKQSGELLFGYGNLPSGIFKSTNSGSNWELICGISGLRVTVGASSYYYGNPFGFVKYNPFDTAFVYANGINNVFISTNGGYNFSSISVKWFYDIIFSPKDSFIYGFNEGKLYKSTNKGIIWDSVQTGLNFNAIEVNPDFPNKLYGGDNYGLYISTNYGLNWTLYNNSFAPTKKVIGISKDSGSGDTLYVATSQNVYKVWASFLVGVNNTGKTLPDKHELYQNYPNPFNPTTKIKFNISFNSGVETQHLTTLKIFDINGREVATLVNESLQPGTYEVTFDGSNLPSGIYFYKLSAGDFVSTKKLILLK
jgi:hypothetical protein